MNDPIDAFLAQMNVNNSGDMFSGSEPVPAQAAPANATPAPEVPVASAPAIVADVANVSVDSALAELIRRVQAIEAFLRRNGADL